KSSAESNKGSRVEGGGGRYRQPYELCLTTISKKHFGKWFICDCGPENKKTRPVCGRVSFNRWTLWNWPLTRPTAFSSVDLILVGVNRNWKGVSYPHPSSPSIRLCG